MMALMDTLWGMRTLRERARLVRFEATAGIMATNVQDAITSSRSTPPPTSIASGQSPYNVSPADSILNVDTTTSPITIVMPQGATRSSNLEIKDINGHAATNNITVTFATGEAADGLSPLVIRANYGGVVLRALATGYTIEP